MEISDLRLEMELNGVSSADIAEIIELCKSKGFKSELIDEELVKRDYEKIFTVDYEKYDSYGGWDEEEEEDEYPSVVKFKHKKQYRE
ncbi:hypothetical protein KKG72_02140 [bacterium]|nr:hypothetical protein [bacterium]